MFVARGRLFVVALHQRGVREAEQAVGLGGGVAGGGDLQRTLEAVGRLAVVAEQRLDASQAPQCRELEALVGARQLVDEVAQHAPGLPTRAQIGGDVDRQLCDELSDLRGAGAEPVQARAPRPQVWRAADEFAHRPGRQQQHERLRAGDRQRRAV